MAQTKTKPRKPTARERLQPSVLRQTQLELMGDDVDLSRLYFKLTTNKSAFNAVEAVTDVQIERTIQGASTVTVTVEDRDGVLLNSGQLAARNDIEIDGLYFRLVSIAKSGQELTLVFEDREVSLLRTYAHPIKQSLKTSRARITRAEFVLRMIREVKEEKIRWIIPELHKQQPIDGAGQLPPTQFNLNNKGFGIPKGSLATVKGSPMNENQRNIANTICQVGASMLLPRKYLVMAIMCATQESSITNLGQPIAGAYNHLSLDPRKNPVGVFQQIAYWGWPASRDVAKDAAAFYQKLIPVVKANPNKGYADCIESVQRSGNPAGYGQWRDEAERTVTAYGMVAQGSASLANSQWAANVGSTVYEFYRGLPNNSKKNKQKFGSKWGPEDSWTCIQRLANEVNWRAFMVSGTFYFISEDDLFKSQPIAVIDEDTPGVDSIDGEYDEASKVATLTVACRMGRWQAPPGSVIQIKNMGPWNGRWLVNDVSRSAFSSNGTITLKKPIPRLPEPSGSNIQQGTTNSQTWHLAPPPGDPPKQFRTASGLVQPVVDGYNTHLVQGIHSTAGLAGQHFPYFTGTWPSSDAADFGGDAGAPVVAPESGTIVYLSGHDPTFGPSDPVMGVHGPFGWSLYLKGDSGSYYFITHLGTRSAVLGAHVTGGQQIGTVGDYQKWGGVNHAHVGVNPQGPTKHPDITDLINALKVKRT